MVLVTDAGEEVLRAGDCAGFKAGDPNGHHLQNRSERGRHGARDRHAAQQDAAVYPDIDLAAPAGGAMYTHRDGTPYLELRRRGPADD